MEANYVKMSIEDYNRMLLKISLYERSLLIKKSWSGEELLVSFDPKVVDEFVTQAVANSEYINEFTLRSEGKWYTADVIIGDVKKQMEVVGDDERTTGDQD